MMYIRLFHACIPHHLYCKQNDSTLCQHYDSNKEVHHGNIDHPKNTR